MEDHNELRMRLVEGYNLTTAEIIYHMPDRPHILQTYIWQDYDIAPEFPVLTNFLGFWEICLAFALHLPTPARFASAPSIRLWVSGPASWPSFMVPV